MVYVLSVYAYPWSHLCVCVGKGLAIAQMFANVPTIHDGMLKMDSVHQPIVIITMEHGNKISHA